MPRGKYTRPWNPDDEPLVPVFVREPASIHARYNAAAAAANQSFTAWDRQALRSALETADDQARYLEMIKHDDENQGAPRFSGREEEVEIEIRLREDGGCEQGGGS